MVHVFKGYQNIIANKVSFGEKYCSKVKTCFTFIGLSPCLVFMQF